MILLRSKVSYIWRECFIVTLFVIHFLANGAFTHLESNVLTTSVNCSEYCQCELKDIQHVLHHYYQRHNSFTGQKFGEAHHTYSKYTSFLGIYSIVVGAIVEINCNINDGRTHAISSLLNGIENLKYTSLAITCRTGENVLWDIPTWQVSFNIFESRGCGIVPEDASKDVVIPMNLWIVDIDNVGDDLINQIDTRYTINTLVLSISGTDTFNIPDKWRGDAMISVDRINLQKNKLKRFDCKIHFTKSLDTINLNNNELTKFPECLLKGNYQNIRFLSLSNNDISDISCLFTADPFHIELEIIDLSHNHIDKIGKFNPMHALSVLDLSNNLITQINDDAFNQLSDLKQLFLQNNRIQYIGPVAFRDNINLWSIKLNSNSLKHARVEQFPSKGNIEIDLRKNKLRSPPFITKDIKKPLPMTFRINAGNNPYNCDCKMIAFEKYVNLMNSQMMNTSKAKDLFLDLDRMKCGTPRSIKGQQVLGTSYTRSCYVTQDCPQNCVCNLVKQSTFIVNCTASRLLEMPDSIPMYPNAEIVFDLSHNPLQFLGYRSYLTNLSELYVDNCLITSITPLAIDALRNVKVLKLHNNLIQKLPSNMRNVTLRRASNVTLHNNRWSCSCDSLWLPQWLSAHRSVLWMPGTIVCNYLKKPVEDFNSADVYCEAFSSIDIVMTLSLIFSSLLSTFLIFFYYNKDIKVILYSKLGIRLGTDFTYGDQFSPYDVFVSYGQDNYNWVVDALVPHLENGPKKYKLCLHYRDFPADESNIDNVPWAIRLSRCSILVLSKEFMKKEWCILELRSVFQRLLMASNKLIVVSTDDVSPEDLTPDLTAYMNMHDHLKIDEPRFWDKLEMFLPPITNPSDGILSLSNPDHAIHEGCGDTEMNPTMDPQYAEGGDNNVSCVPPKNDLSGVGDYASQGGQ